MYAFTFRQIEVFLEICRTGNFSSAADRLQVSQPAISNVIRALESELGITLFHRRRGASSELSREGMAFRDSALQFVSQCEALGRAGRGARKRSRPLRVFVGGHLLEDVIRPLLPEFHEEHPNIVMNFLPERSRDQVLHEIQEGRIDVVVITAPRDEKIPATLRLGDVPTGIYCTRAHRAPFTPASISAMPFILPSGSSQLANSTMRALEKHDILPSNVAGTCQYHDVRVRMACQGKGAIFSIQSIVDSHDKSGVLRMVFAMEPWERRVYIDPRVESASASAVASFMTRALAITPSSVTGRSSRQ